MPYVDSKFIENLSLGIDSWENITPVIRLEDTPDKDETLPIKISVLIGLTGYRVHQLARTLECLARQTFRDFEVLVCDDGGLQNTEAVCSLFNEKLRIRYFKLERDGFSACPSKAIKYLIPYAMGTYIALLAPEAMLTEDALGVLYDSHLTNVKNTWINLKFRFISEDNQHRLDEIDWHSDVRRIETLPDFFNYTYWPGCDNHAVEREPLFLHWYCSSGHRNLKLWEDFPVFISHALLDHWLTNFRGLSGNYLFEPKMCLGYHQYHTRIQDNFKLQSEEDFVSGDGITKYLIEKYGTNEEQWFIDRL